MIFDTHAHYDDGAFDEDRDELLNGLAAAGVGDVVNVSSDLGSVDRSLALAGRYPFIRAALGIHPSDCGGLTEEDFAGIADRLSSDRVVAVGEIGLDYHWDNVARDVQEKWFRHQLDMAREADLPVIIHSRDAAEDTLRILKDMRAGRTGGVVHCFSYSPEIAEICVNMGFHIGVGGVVTYKNGRRLKETVARIPAERIVLETDCPYLAPEPRRGRRNDSRLIAYVAEAVAGIRGCTAEEVIALTARNARQLYRLAE